MNEACPLPTGAPAPDPEGAGGARLEPLRRFHFGDPAAASAPLAGDLLPAALHRFRGAAVRGGWPLLVEPAAAGEAFARPLAEWLAGRSQTLPEVAASRPLVDNLARVELAVVEAAGAAASLPAAAALSAALERAAGVLALPAAERAAWDAAATALAAALGDGAALVPFSRPAPLALAGLAARRRQLAARAAFAAEAQELAATVAALLEADRARRPGELGAEERAGQLGGLAHLIDATRLSGVVAQRKAGAPFDAARRRRLEAAGATLAAFAADPAEPVWVLGAAAGAPAAAGEVRRAEDPCAVAAAAFDAAAAEVAGLARAARLVRLEAADAYEEERHGPGLERLDWRGFAAAELALVPPVVALVEESALLAGALPSLVRLLLSGRPVQVVMLRAGDDGDAGACRLEPAYLAVGLREVFVQQGSLARPVELAAAFARAFGGTRAGLHVVDAPAGAPADLDAWLVASARVSGRAAPLFRYDPEAGASWARRLRFADNPEPAADWPREELAGLAPGDAPAAAAFTYADAALLDPAWRTHFAPAGGDAEDLVPLADWLALPPEETARRLPFVWGAAADGAAQRLVVSRALALAARDRLGFWRTLEELAGVRNEHVEEAVAAARREADQKAAAERAKLEAKHAADLQMVAEQADEVAVDRLISTIFEVEPQFSVPSDAERARRQKGENAAGPQAGVPRGLATISTPAPEAGTAAGEIGACPPLGAGQPAGERAEASGEPAAAEEEEAWVDTAMCTSCDECTRKYPAIFQYNGNKQAFVKDPRGGRFRDLVEAAEKCTAKIIHPGTPWDPSEPDLASWVERARKFG